MTPLFVLAIGLLANVAAVAVTHAFAPDWQVGAASVSAFLCGMAYQQARMRPRLATLEVVLTVSGRRP